MRFSNELQQEISNSQYKEFSSSHTLLSSHKIIRKIICTFLKINEIFIQVKYRMENILTRLFAMTFQNRMSLFLFVMQNVAKVTEKHVNYITK